MVSCQEEDLLRQAMEFIRRYLLRIRKDEEIQIIGPAAESVSKINDMYRSVLYIRDQSGERLVQMRESWNAISRLTGDLTRFIYSLISILTSTHNIGDCETLRESVYRFVITTTGGVSAIASYITKEQE